MEINSLVGNTTLINSILDKIYPIGCYFETSDTNFDPNESLIGTWTRDTDGRVLVSESNSLTIGSTGGESTHTLTANEMPSHTHSLYPTGKGWVNSDANTGRINLNHVPSGKYVGIISTTGMNGWVFKGIDKTGGGEAHNNMPPYIVIARWHRTA